MTFSVICRITFVSIFNHINNTIMRTQTLFESTKEFKPIWDSLPKGTVCWKVKTFDGNTGNSAGIEYTLDRNDLEAMTAVSDGYFFETYKMTK